MRALDARAVADDGVPQLAHGPDHAIVTDGAGAGDRRKRVDHGVSADPDIGIYISSIRVGDGDAADHEPVQDPVPHDALGVGQLPPVVDAQDLEWVLDGDSMHLALDEPDDVRQVILAGAVLVLELRQRRPELAARKAIDPRVDLANLALLEARIFFFNDFPEYAVSPTHDPAVTARIVESGRQDRHRGAG